MIEMMKSGHQQEELLCEENIEQNNVNISQVHEGTRLTIYVNLVVNIETRPYIRHDKKEQMPIQEGTITH